MPLCSPPDYQKYCNIMPKQAREEHVFAHNPTTKTRVRTFGRYGHHRHYQSLYANSTMSLCRHRQHHKQPPLLIQQPTNNHTLCGQKHNHYYPLPTITMYYINYLYGDQGQRNCHPCAPLIKFCFIFM